MTKNKHFKKNEHHVSEKTLAKAGAILALGAGAFMVASQQNADAGENQDAKTELNTGKSLNVLTLDDLANNLKNGESTDVQTNTGYVARLVNSLPSASEIADLLNDPNIKTSDVQTTYAIQNILAITDSDVFYTAEPFSQSGPTLMKMDGYRDLLVANPNVTVEAVGDYVPASPHLYTDQSVARADSANWKDSRVVTSTREKEATLISSTQADNTNFRADDGAYINNVKLSTGISVDVKAPSLSSPLTDNAKSDFEDAVEKGFTVQYNGTTYHAVYHNESSKTDFGHQDIDGFFTFAESTHALPLQINNHFIVMSVNYGSTVASLQDALSLHGVTSYETTENWVDTDASNVNVNINTAEALKDDGTTYFQIQALEQVINSLKYTFVTVAHEATEAIEDAASAVGGAIEDAASAVGSFIGGPVVYAEDMSTRSQQYFDNWQNYILVPTQSTAQWTSNPNSGTPIYGGISVDQGLTPGNGDGATWTVDHNNLVMAQVKSTATTQDLADAVLGALNFKITSGAPVLDTDYADWVTVFNGIKGAFNPTLLSAGSQQLQIPVFKSATDHTIINSVYVNILIVSPDAQLQAPYTGATPPPIQIGSDKDPNVDKTPPVLSNGNNFSVVQSTTALTSDQIIDKAGITATDAAGSDTTITVDSSAVQWNVPGTYNVNFTAADVYGNTTAPKSIQITVTAASSAQFTAGNDITIAVSKTALTNDQYISQAGIKATDPTNSANAITYLANFSGVNWGLAGTYQVTTTATVTASGATAQITHNVIVTGVLDTTAPVLTANDFAITQTTTALTNAQIISQAGATATDNSGVTPTITVTSSNLNTNAPGTYQAVLTATDGSGNTATKTVNITVNAPDKTAPVFAATTDYSIPASPAKQTDAQIIAQANVTATDNSGVTPTITITNNPIVSNKAGTYTVTFTATDAAGNKATTTAVVTVTDTTAPTVSGNNFSYEATQTTPTAAQIQAAAAAAGASATDGSGTATLTFSTSGVIWNTVGSYQMTINATDPSGNVGSKVVTVTVTDKTKPTITAAGFTQTVSLSNTPLTTAQITAAAKTATADNATGAVTVAYNTASVVWNKAGIYAVTATATDAAGNVSAPTTFYITLTAAAAPTVTGSAFTTNLTGTALTADQITAAANVVAKDAQGNALTPTYDTTAVQWNRAGSYNIKVIATDASGTKTTTTLAITIKDTTPPSITASDVTYAASGTAKTVNQVLADANAIATDASTSAPKITANLGNVNWQTPGTYAVTLTATDGAGNTATKTINVIITGQQIVAPAQVPGVEVTNNYGNFVQNSTVDYGKASDYYASHWADYVAINTGQEPTIPSQYQSSSMAANTIGVYVNGQLVGYLSWVANSVLVNPSNDIQGYQGSNPGATSEANMEAALNAAYQITFTPTAGGTLTSLPNINYIGNTLNDKNNSQGMFTANGPYVPMNWTYTAANGTVTTVSTDPVAGAYGAIQFKTVSNGAYYNPIFYVGFPLQNKALAPTSTVGDPTLTSTQNANDPWYQLDTKAPQGWSQKATVELGTAPLSQDQIMMLTNTMSDNDGNVPALSLNQDDVAAIDWTKVGTYNVRVTATDNAGNTSIATIQIKIVDTTAPSLTEKTDVTQEATQTPVSNDDLLALAGITTSDLSGIKSTTLDTSKVDWNTVGNYQVGVTVTDNAGNITTGSFTVHIVDTTAPIIAAADVQREAGAAPTDMQSVFGAAATDNSDSAVTVSYDTSAVSWDMPGTYDVIVSATDGTNTSTKTIHITIYDDEAPIVTAGNATYEVNSNVPELSDFLNDIKADATDNSGTKLQLDADLSSVDFTKVGSYQVEVTASDGTNVGSTYVTVTIADTKAPTITAKDVTVELGSDPLSEAQLIADSDLTVTDNSGSDSYTISGLDDIDWSAAAVGKTQTVTVTATDASKNVSTGTITIVVGDTTAPTVVGGTTTVNVAQDGSNALSDAAIIALVNATDLSGSNFTYTVTNGAAVDYTKVGSYDVTVHVTDPSGNSADATVNVVVNDTTAPVVNAKTTINQEAGPTGLDNAALLAAIGYDATDNSGAFTTVVTGLDTINWQAIGAKTATVTTKDAAGNTTTTTVTINIVDTTPPTATADGFTIEKDSTLSNDDILRLSGYTASDNSGSTTNVIDGTVNTHVPGDYKVTISTSDGSGHTITNVITVTVQDTVAPTNTTTIADNGDKTSTITVVTDDTEATITIGGQEVTNVGGVGTLVVANDGSSYATSVTDEAGLHTDGTATTKDQTPAEVDVKYDSGDTEGETSKSPEGTITVTTEPGATVVIDGDTDNPYTADENGKVVVDVKNDGDSHTVDVSDKAGNPSEQQTITTVDNTAPTLDTDYETGDTEETPKSPTGTITITTDDPKATITVDGNEITNDNGTGSIDVPNDGGSHEIVVTDPAGNTTTETVTTDDQTPPEVTVTVPDNGDGTSNVDVSTEPDATITIDGKEVPNDGGSGTTTVPNDGGDHTVVVTDPAGNETTETISTPDQTAPTLSVTASDVSHEAGSSVPSDADLLAQIDAITSDHSDDVTVTISGTDDVDWNTKGNYTVTVTATDPDKNATSVDVTVHVTDTTPPTVTGDAGIGVNSSDPALTTDQIIEQAHVVGHDNATGDVKLDVDDSKVQWTVPGSYDVTVTPTDANGNPGDSITVVVTVTDTTPPVSNAGNFTTTTAVGKLTDNQILENASYTASDNSGEYTTTIEGKENVEWGTPGSYDVTIVTTDAAGKHDDKTITITITDDTPPVITVDPDVSEAGAISHEAGSDIPSINEILNEAGISATDNDGKDVTWTIDESTVQWDTKGDYAAVASATDATGHTSTTSITVHVTDTTPPSVSGKDLTVQSESPALSVDEIKTQANITASDNASGTIKVDVDDSQVQWTVPGTYDVTVTATDANGISNQTTITITVEDNTPPVVNADDFTVDAGTTLTPQDVLDNSGYTATDNDGKTPSVVVNGLDDVDTNTPGDYVVHIVTTDDAGNPTDTKVTITVDDETPPSITIDPNVTDGGQISHEAGSDIPTQQEILDGAGMVITDNADTPLTTTVDTSNVKWDTEGDYTATVSVTDEANHTTTADITVHVTDTTPPTVTGDAGIGVNSSDPALTTDQIIEQAHVVGHDNATGDVKLDVDDSKVQWTVPGSYDVTVTPTDANGNPGDSITVVVTVTDNTKPIASAGDFSSTTSAGKLDDDSILAKAGYTASDNSGKYDTDVDTSKVNWTAPGSYDVTITTSDAAGNSVDKTITITITDDTPPVINSDNKVPVNHEAGSTIPSINQIINGAGISATDNDGKDVIWTVDTSDVKWDTKGTYGATATATDEDGNKSSVAIVINVTDKTPPTLTADGFTVNSSDPALTADQAIAKAGASATDNATGTITITVDDSKVQWANPGSYDLIVTATDANGNATSKTVQVTVNDTTPPDVNVDYTPGSGTTGTITVTTEPDITVTIDGKDYTSDGNGQVTITVPNDGRNHEVTATDDAGNTSDPQTVTTKDQTPPKINVNGGNATYVVGSDPEAHEVISDAGVTTSGIKPRPINVTVDLSTVNWNKAGDYEVVVTADDGIGNVSTTTITVTVTAKPVTVNFVDSEGNIVNSYVQMVDEIGNHYIVTVPDGYVLLERAHNFVDGLRDVVNFLVGVQVEAEGPTTPEKPATPASPEAPAAETPAPAEPETPAVEAPSEVAPVAPAATPAAPGLPQAGEKREGSAPLFGVAAILASFGFILGAWALGKKVEVFFETEEGELLKKQTIRVRKNHEQIVKTPDGYKAVQVKDGELVEIEPRIDGTLDQVTFIVVPKA
jgi:hypothetical protein